MQAALSKLVRARMRFEHIQRIQLDFIRSLPSLRKAKGKRNYNIRIDQRERLCEMAFVAIFTSWEEFLETSFENYLAPGSKMTKLVVTKVKVVDVSTARDVIRGDRRYVDWADPDQVRTRAKVFFEDGEPYETAISSALGYLKKMRVIRNRCVHFSQYAADQYNKMIREIFGAGKKVTPGHLLLNPPPSGILSAGLPSNCSSTFELFTAVLDTACCIVVP